MISLEVARKKITTENVKHGHAKYLIAMAVEIVLLYILNNFLHNYITPLTPYVANTYPGFVVNIINTLANLRVPYFTSAFTSCLWAVNVALTFAIIANLALLLFHPRWFHHLLKGLIFSLAVLPTYVVLKTFPFEFDTSTQASIARVILIIILSGMAIGFAIKIVYFVSALFRKIKNDKGKTGQSPEPTPGSNSQELSKQLPEDSLEPPRTLPPPSSQSSS